LGDIYLNGFNVKERKAGTGGMDGWANNKDGKGVKERTRKEDHKGRL
jgi:hypothetical protein